MGLLDKILKRAKPAIRKEAKARGIPTTEREATNRIQDEVKERTSKDGKQ